ncbi:MAG: ABC transporter permease subunit [Limimaricola sp.]|uniref:ABC transporter permease n=1 Tax=Limimaricola sp. TaxID=2211665 RepID=UPI001D994C4A|nr:ABC transporter permease subunit [Limimaricola sp.]MBI1418894.1 ABC transporter permease subunit [Limimaricola sp.]
MSDAIMTPAAVAPSPIRTIAAKDIRDALRDRFVLIVTVFLGIAAVVALLTGAIALRNDVATYDAAKATLLALGKSAGEIKAPEFYPLRLLRGAIEQIEIIGAAISILIGYRAAASERGRQTLALMLTRPMRPWQFVAGKALAGIALLAGGLALVLGMLTAVLHLSSGVGLVPDDLLRIAIVWGVAVAYSACFFLVAFILTLHMRQISHALLAAFAVWLTLVLIAPQVGDTLDPDNQVAGGVFAQLQISKPDQTQIMKGFATFEALRNGIEEASVTKHFERFTFAVLGIKSTYTGMALWPVLVEMTSNLIWIVMTVLGLGALALALPLNPDRLAKA